MGSGGKGHTVRWLRLNLGLTVEEVALAAHVSPNTVRGLERGGRSTILAHEIERRVATALGVDPVAIAWGAAEDADDGTLSLATLREGRKLTPGQVAEQSGVPVRSVRRAEAGSAIQPRYALRLADFYGCRVTSFYPRALRQAA